MKKAFVLLLTVICLLSFVGCVSEKKEEEVVFQKDVYTFDLSLEKNELICKIDLLHDVKADGEQINFYSPARDYVKIEVNDREVEYEVKEGVLSLFSPFKTGRYNFAFEYVLPVEENAAPFGKAGNVYYAIAFYPQAYEGEILPFAYEKPSLTLTPFDFSAQIKLPKNMFTLSSGKVISDEKGENERIVKIEGENVRDMTFTSSAAFVNRSQGKTRYYFVSDKDQKNTLKKCEERVEVFDELFGEYFDELYVVKGAFPYSYASDNMVLIKDDGDNDFDDELTRTVSGEWWGQVVAANGKIPFLQDGLRGFSTLLFYLKSGDGKKFNALKKELENVLEKRVIAGKDNALGKTTYEFGEDYGAVFDLGTLAFFELYSLYGADFLDGLKRFAKENADEIVYMEDLYSAFDNKSEYTVFLSAWLDGKVVHALKAHTSQKVSVEAV